MQGEKEKVRDTTEGSGQQQQVTSNDEEPNPVGQDSAKSEYGEIGDEGAAQRSPAQRRLRNRHAGFPIR